MENKIHYEKFKEFVQQTPDLNQGAVGVSPRDFWKTIICDGGITFKGVEVDSKELSENKLNREEVLDIIENKETNFIIKIISIFAWGKMKPENAVRFFGHYHKYKEALEKILTNEEKERMDMFREIKKLKLKNCQSPYFTKLLFFFTATSNKPGYIMDQWTAKSINMITGELLVKLDKDGYVTGSNKGGDYERFCSIIDDLANHMYDENEYNGSQIEQYLFDNGGTKPGKWRAYVDKNYVEISKTLKKVKSPKKEVSKPAKNTKTNKKRQSENIQGPFYLEKTKAGSYFALRYESKNSKKIGRIEDSGWLFAKEELVQLIDDPKLEWIDISKDKIPENFKCKFEDFESCKTFLRNKSLLLEKMEIKYKKFVVDYLFGLIEGSAKGLEEAIKDDFLIDFNFEPEKLEVIGKDKFIKNENGSDIWIGAMTVKLIIDGEEFNVTRNWEEEYYVDIKHPDYKIDEDFYDSQKPYSSKKYREIINSLGRNL